MGQGIGGFFCDSETLSVTLVSVEIGIGMQQARHD